MISYLMSGLKNENIKWTDADNIHLTLAFLGDTEESSIREISSILKEKCEGFGKFDFIIKGCGVFRNMNDPRIIWTGIEPSDKVNMLNDLIMSGLNQLKIKMEERPFKPHITIGRIKQLNNPELLKSVIMKFHNSDIQTVPVNEVILFESILLKTGPVYKTLATISL
jgi:2'-5' RNA ligase